MVWFLFYITSLKSRVYNPLNNSRPKLVKEDVVKGFNDRIMPKWTPPGFIFPIVWLLIVSPLRATASTMIVQAKASFLNLPLLSLMLHLSVGDVWNTINNTERRYGTSVLGVVAVWFSAVHAAYQYYRISPLAGRLLGATCIWLTIAATLIGQTWRLNGKEPLLPMIASGQESKTKFVWGSG
jgi:tryptophan-rich sensory protein